MILKLKVWLLKRLLDDVAKHGIEGDTKLAHINDWEDKLLKAVGGEGSINPYTNLVQYKGGGGGSSQTTNELDPAIRPYVVDALQEQKNLYNQGAPQYYGGQTYLDPNAQQQSAMTSIANQAQAGSPELQQANQLASQVMGGDFLQNNPYFNAVMDTAGRKATDIYNKATQKTASDVSMANRYGSDAHARLQSGNADALAKSLADTAGQYSYANFANERQNQMNVMNNAQNFANNNYYDASKLMQVGNQQAMFDQAALDADIARHDYGQNAQQQHLANYTNAVWGAPGGSRSVTSQSGGGK